MKKTGGGPPTQEYTPAEELALCNNGGQYKKLTGKAKAVCWALNTLALLKSEPLRMKMPFTKRIDWSGGCTFIYVDLLFQT